VGLWLPFCPGKHREQRRPLLFAAGQISRDVRSLLGRARSLPFPLCFCFCFCCASCILLASWIWDMFMVAAPGSNFHHSFLLTLPGGAKAVHQSESKTSAGHPDDIDTTSHPPVLRRQNSKQILITQPSVQSLLACAPNCRRRIQSDLAAVATTTSPLL